jgi:methylated-DNA-protein-cysteine methyltransferase-like protein
VVRADGSLPKGAEQRRLLQGEGVSFRGSRVDLKHAWVDVAALSGSSPTR